MWGRKPVPRGRLTMEYRMEHTDIAWMNKKDSLCPFLFCSSWLLFVLIFRLSRERKSISNHHFRRRKGGDYLLFLTIEGFQRYQQPKQYIC